VSVHRPFTPGLRIPAELAAAGLVGAAAAATQSPLLVVAALLGAGFVVFAIHRIVGAIALFVVLSFVEQLPGGGVSVVKLAGAVVVAVWLGGLAMRRWSPPAAIRERPITSACVAGLIVWALASAAWAFDPHTAVSAALRLAQGAIVVFVLAGCGVERRALRLLMAAFVAGGTLSAFLGLVGVGGAAVADASGAVTTRVGGGLGDPNYLAAVLVPALVFALALARTSPRRAERIALGVAAAVMLFALVRTESRGGLVAVVATLVAALAVGGRLRRPLLAWAGAAVVVGAVAFALFASTSSLHRLTSFSSDGGSGRTELWSVAGDVVRAHPLAGVGAGNFPVVEATYAARTNTNLTKVYLELTEHEVVHNTYLHIFAELGVVGLILLVSMIVGAIGASYRVCRSLGARGDDEGELLTRALVLGAIGMFVAFAFLTAQYEKQLWIVLGLLLAAATSALPTGPPRARGRGM
jgi:O-antigen ligase